MKIAPHWSYKYINKPCKGHRPCAEFYKQVMQEQFNIQVELPQESMSGYRLYVRVIEKEINNGRYMSITNPKDGDTVLMNCLGYLNHIGIFCELPDGLAILHARTASRQTGLTKLDRLLPTETIAGYYRYKK